ncbi:MAG: MFS transporter [Acidimicrobiales bacterium]
MHAPAPLRATRTAQPGQGLLAAWTCVTMVFGTVAGPAVGILASTLIERFDLTRADIGRLAALYALVGAAVSPLTGRLADRLGGRRMMAATFLGGAVTFAAYATAGGAAMLLVAAALSGIPNGTGNQATNRLIATTLPVTQRGLVTGVKQSGVQLGRFLAGMILPTTVAAWGLGASYTALAVLALAGAAVTLRLLPADAPAASPGAGAAAPAQRLSAAVWWLAGYAFLLGAVAGATSAFTALFAEQEVGFTRGQAGFMVGLTGGAAVVSRIALSRVAQRVAHYGPALAWIAFGSALSIALTAASPGSGAGRCGRGPSGWR